MTYEDKSYGFDHSFMNPLVMSSGVPSSERPSVDYIARRLAATADVPLNFAAAAAHNLLDNMNSLEDYDDMFVIMKKPKCVQTWQRDQIFAEQRLAGVHPVWIRRVTSLDNDERNRISDPLLRIIGTDDFEETLSNHLYVCDYREVLSDLPVGSWEGRTKHVLPSTSYFVWRSTQFGDRGELVPIMVDFTSSKSDRVTVTPLDPVRLWRLAKLHCQVADANVHEMWSHLYGAHFSMEPIAVATGRYLEPDHPVRRVLVPHLKFLLFNNDLGKQKLINPGGFVDQLLANSLAGSLEISKRASRDFHFVDGAFPNDVTSRRMDSIPHYPYRDDGMLLWNAIGDYVEDCVKGSYPDHESVTSDEQLVRWWGSLLSPNLAGVRGVPDTMTVESLTFILQRIIFTSGPYHAAVNYSQYEYMAYSPNMPLAAYSSDVKDGTLLDTLPPFQQAVKQLEIMEVLTNYRHDKIGYYDSDDLARLSSTERTSLDLFQKSLTTAEEIIDRRNLVRKIPYVYLKPSLVPNSTSV